MIDNNRKYDKELDSDDDIYPISIWFELVQLGMIGNYDGSGYWMKDGKASHDEVFSTQPYDATHVVWYNK